MAGVSEGLQAGGFTDASAVRVDVRNARSREEAKEIGLTVPDAAIRGATRVIR